MTDLSAPDVAQAFALVEDDGALFTSRHYANRLARLLIPDVRRPTVAIEPLAGETAAAVVFERGRLPKIVFDPRFLTGVTWPGPKATRQDMNEALVLVITHELSHVRVSSLPGMEHPDDHGASFLDACRHFARTLGISPPDSADDARQWPYSRFETDDGTAGRIMHLAGLVPITDDDPAVCQSCGADNPPGEMFCRSCGRRIAPNDAKIAGS